jgi:dCMP deaminase
MKNWDEWYLEVCNVVAQKSNCLSRQIGSVLVRDKSIISQGYNGPPRGIPHCNERYNLDPELANLLRQDGKIPCDEDLETKCPRYIAGFKTGEGLEWCVAGHSERNSIINAARNGISTKGCKLYMNCGIPCTPCLVEIINAGIEEIIVVKFEYYDISAEYVLKNSHLKYRMYNHLVDVSKILKGN